MKVWAPEVGETDSGCVLLGQIILFNIVHVSLCLRSYFVLYICIDILKVSLVWICYYHHLLLPVGPSPSLATKSVVTFNILSTYEVGVGT